ncbi:hypothetical protein AB0G79_24850 [Streptomyces sp. NPDC020807]|uniref:hypothetical protein n=1 Tax=Streptomyces sp. NPDC020807 TaxID=3155119 RepID=UPI0033F010F5
MTPFRSGDSHPEPPAEAPASAPVVVPGEVPGPRTARAGNGPRIQHVVVDPPAGAPTAPETGTEAPPAAPTRPRLGSVPVGEPTRGDAAARRRNVPTVRAVRLAPGPDGATRHDGGPRKQPRTAAPAAVTPVPLPLPRPTAPTAADAAVPADETGAPAADGTLFATVAPPAADDDAAPTESRTEEPQP